MSVITENPYLCRDNVIFFGMNFLVFIFFLVVVVWLIGLIGRASINRWLKKRADEYNRAAKAAQREAKRAARGKREGDVTIEATEAAFQKKVSRDVGDYVEFEEVAETYEERQG